MDTDLENEKIEKQRQLLHRNHLGKITHTNTDKDGPTVTWEESATEPHSTSNPEEDLTTYSDAFSSGKSELEDLLYHFSTVVLH